MNKNIIDITGKKYGMLTVTSHSHSGYWNCVCECGKISVHRGSDMKNGKIKSCGHARYADLKKRNKTHGDSKTKLYRVWRGIIGRCFYPSATGYNNYGGRGISVCSEWRNSFELFKKWALNNGYSDKLSIERKDNNGDYTPYNCTWATAKEQSKNKRKRQTYNRTKDGKFKKNSF